LFFLQLGLAITTHAQSYYYGTSTSYPPVWSDLGPSYDRFASGCYQDCSYSPSPYYQSWNNNFYYSNTSTRDIWVYSRLNYQPYYSSYYPSTTYSYADVSTNDDSDDEPRLTTSSVTSIGDDDSYNEEVDELEADETYYVRLCVEYDDDDKVLMCGSTRDFETDN